MSCPPIVSRRRVHRLNTQVITVRAGAIAPMIVRMARSPRIRGSSQMDWAGAFSAARAWCILATTFMRVWRFVGTTDKMEAELQGSSFIEGLLGLPCLAALPSGWRGTNRAQFTCWLWTSRSFDVMRYKSLDPHEWRAGSFRGCELKQLTSFFCILKRSDVPSGRIELSVPMGSAAMEASGF